MVINNYDIIKDFIDFGPDDFYFMQILKRRKENPEMAKGEQVIKSYFIDNHEYFEKKMPEIIQLCEDNNARAYFNLNKRNYLFADHDMITYINNSIRQGQPRNCKNAFEKMAGANRSDKDKKWILDIDTKILEVIYPIQDFINGIKPNVEKTYLVL
ncbi:MAG: hypothetical protein ACOC1K_03435, partial [Nanoarchaeota archaeon]